MKRYESPEAVEIGRAVEMILGWKIEWFWDWITEDFSAVESGAVDVDE